MSEEHLARAVPPMLLLGHLERWRDALELARRRLENSGPGPSRTLDAYTVAATLRALLRACEIAWTAYPSARIEAARDAFEERVPNHGRLREALEHFDAPWRVFHAEPIGTGVALARGLHHEAIIDLEAVAAALDLATETTGALASS